MEVFTPPPFREKRPHGRPAKFTHEVRLTIGRKVVEKEMTYREAAEFFQMSQGAVAACIELFKKTGANARNCERKKEVKEDIENYRHQGQIKELKQEIADLYLENQMLKKS